MALKLDNSIPKDPYTKQLCLPEMQKAVKNYPGEHVPAIFSLPVPIVE